MLRVALCLLLLLQGAIALGQALEPTVLREAERLVRAGRAEEAWRLLVPLERRHAGELEFDYLLAVSALESGRPDRATFVLERVLAANPAHLPARLELARAYFELGDRERAEREFRSILRGAPSSELRSLSQSYLEAMRRNERRARSAFSGYAELAIGHDTNVSTASAQGTVFVPGLGTQVLLDPRFARRADEFFAVGAGLDYAHPLDAGAAAAASVDVRQRWHSDAGLFDARSADLELALTRPLGGRARARLNVLYSDPQLDYAPYRDMQGLGAQWSLDLGERWRITVSGQGYRIRYRSADTIENSSDLVGGTVSLARRLEWSRPTTAWAALVAAHDNAIGGRADGDRRLAGLSAGLQRSLQPELEAYVRLSLLESRYDMQNPGFGVLRRDRQRDAAFGMAWSFAGGWQLRPQVARTVNRSNLPLNEYRRTEASLALRRVWD